MHSYAASACHGFENDGTMIAAASGVLWRGGAACDERYVVQCTGATNAGVPHPCTGKSVTVRIVDLCPAGCRGTIDLSQEAFAVIADPNAGKINIEYRRYVGHRNGTHDSFSGFYTLLMAKMCSSFAGSDVRSLQIKACYHAVVKCIFLP
jgi:hypothetical protein